jgi:hypothetical protein
MRFYPDAKRPYTAVVDWAPDVVHAIQRAWLEVKILKAVCHPTHSILRPAPDGAETR